MKRRWCAAVLIILAAQSVLEREACSQEKIGVAIPYTVVQIDPFAVQDPVNRLILSNIGYGLARRDSDGLAGLELAEKIQRGPAGRTWSCVVRAGVHYTDGSQLTAESVKRSFEYYQRRAAALNESTISAKSAGEHIVQAAPSKTLIGQLLNIAKINVLAGERGAIPMSLEFQLHQAAESFDRDVLTLPILNPDIAEQIADSDFGTSSLAPFLGPYEVLETKPGQSVTLQAVSIFDNTEPPPIKLIEFRVFEEPRGALSALRAGSVSVIAFPTTVQFLAIQSDPTVIKLPSPLKNLVTDLGWQLSNLTWLASGDSEQPKIDSLIVRRSLDLGARGAERFDLSEARFTLDAKAY